jgi:hypothetical protein
MAVAKGAVAGAPAITAASGRRRGARGNGGEAKADQHMWRPRWKHIFVGLRALRRRLRPGRESVKERQSGSSVYREEAVEPGKSSSSSVSSFSCHASPMLPLDHSAARHRIAVRPQRKHARSRRASGGGGIYGYGSVIPDDAGTVAGFSVSSSISFRRGVAATVSHDALNFSDGGSSPTTLSSSAAALNLLGRSKSLCEQSNVPKRRASTGQASQQDAHIIDEDAVTATSLSRRHSFALDQKTSLPSPSLTCSTLAAAFGGLTKSTRTPSTPTTGSSGPASGASFRPSSVNSNVTFRRYSPAPKQTSTAAEDDDGKRRSTSSSCSPLPMSSASSDGGSALAHKRFLTSVEHWTLANEGLRKSICNLGPLWPLAASMLAESAWDDDDSELLFIDGDENIERYNDMKEDDICKILEDLSRAASEASAVELPSTSSGRTSGQETESSSVGVTSDAQCEAGDSELEVRAEDRTVKLTAPSRMGAHEEVKTERNDKPVDELENVNVREMRKIFIIPDLSSRVAPGIPGAPPLRLARSFSGLPSSSEPSSDGDKITRRPSGCISMSNRPPPKCIGTSSPSSSSSVVRALILKFDGIKSSPPPTSL